jgi:hypothetical protein
VDAPADADALVDVATVVDVAAAAAVVGVDELSLPHPTASNATATTDKKKSVAGV